MTQQEFSDRYTYNVAVDRIGGTVYKAYDNLLHRNVAIKVSELKTTVNGKQSFSLKDRFEALSHLPKHPNIANYEEFYSFEMDNGVSDFAVMQYYPEGNLTQAIKQGLSDEQKEEIATQLLEGIGFLHQHRVVHCDLKPSNILIVRQGGKVIPLITDFLNMAAETDYYGRQSRNSFGINIKNWYSSPEQLRGGYLSSNTDLWSYGAILYELFTGEFLFGPNNGTTNGVSEFEVFNNIIYGEHNLSKMPERWRKVAERCLVVNSGKRVKMAEELMILKDSYGEDAQVLGGIPALVLDDSKQHKEKYGEDAHVLGGIILPDSILDDSKRRKKKKGLVGKGKKGLWIGLAFAFVVVMGLLLFLLLKSAPE